jgi:hypothetical protein
MARTSKRSYRLSSGIPKHPRPHLTIPGQRRAVWEGRARETSGGLTRDDLMVSRSTGKIVSIRASNASKRNFVINGLRPDMNIASKAPGRYIQDHGVADNESMEWLTNIDD